MPPSGNMKLALILGAFSIGTRPLDFSNLWDNPRGLTGTDLCFIRTAQELEKLGHEVHLYTVFSKPGEFQHLHPVNEISQIDESFDGVISINEPNLLINMNRKPYKVVWQMLNDFSFIQPGFDAWVDHYFGVCQEHTNFVSKQCPDPSKWSTIPLGCDPDQYTDQRIPGRVIWCSSADRGLHWLLQQWPEIKAAVPEASLRVFYHFNYDGVLSVEPHSISPQGGPYHPNVIELAQRVRYIKEMLPRLKALDVEHVGSVSRNRMREEFSKASVFGFSCDTVAFSEGFSVSTLEAHASFTVPVITSQDCLGGIYQESGCLMVPAPVKQHLADYTSKVIEALQNPILSSNIIAKSRQFAKAHTWEKAAETLATHIKEHL